MYYSTQFDYDGSVSHVVLCGVEHGIGWHQLRVFDHCLIFVFWQSSLQGVRYVATISLIAGLFVLQFRLQ